MTTGSDFLWSDEGDFHAEIQHFVTVRCSGLVVKVRSFEKIEQLRNKKKGTLFDKFTFLVDNEEAGRNGPGKHIECQVCGYAVQRISHLITAVNMVNIYMHQFRLFVTNVAKLAISDILH